MAAILPTYSPAFNALFASCFFEAQRRQNRHLKITDKFGSPTDSSWQISLPERLFGLSHLGLFSFDFFATSSPDQLVFADANHPMVKYGRMPPPSDDSVIAKLRAKYPDVPELQASIVDGGEILMHGICSIAAVESDALFYYRCPNNAAPGFAVWIIVKQAVQTTSLPSVPANLATLTPPSQLFGSYDAVAEGFESHRPVGGAVRLNEFRINLTTMLTQEFPPGTDVKAMVLGFFQRNGYQVEERPHVPSEGAAAQVEDAGPLVDVVALVDNSPGLTVVFDSMNRLRSIQMAITGDAYATDDFSLQ